MSIPDVEPETPAAPLSLPRIDWSPITAGGVALLAVAGGVVAIITDVADVADPQASHLSVVLTVAASCLALMAVQLGTSYTRRRRDMARDRALHQLAADCHTETVEYLAAIAREMEQLSVRVGPGPLALDSVAPEQASKVFELGRRMGHREASPITPS